MLGLEILAFPCNQFLKKEPGTSIEAHDFACTRYKAQYPIFGKVYLASSTLSNSHYFLLRESSIKIRHNILINFF